MTLVIDANILFSALMDPTTAATKLITDRRALMYVPQFCTVELFKYKERILKYAKIPETELYDVLEVLLKALRIIDQDDIADKHRLAAARLCDGIDPKDTEYVAAALALNATLWTGDKKLITGLRAKGFEDVVTTAELLRTFQ